MSNNSPINTKVSVIKQAKKLVDIKQEALQSIERAILNKVGPIDFRHYVDICYMFYNVNTRTANALAKLGTVKIISTQKDPTRLDVVFSTGKFI